MRILGRLPHPKLQITVFANDGRFPVQFEHRGLTQQYRFRSGPKLTGFADIATLIDDRFTEEVMAIFVLMQATHARATSQIADRTAGDDLPTII